MATSRTGTAKYLRNRRRVLAQAKADGLTHCPGYEGHPCGRQLNWDVPLLPESVEADHIIEHRHSPDDSVENLRALCRACNLDRNRVRVPVEVAPADAFPLSREW